jgi:hypothetical protein
MIRLKNPCRAACAALTLLGFVAGTPQAVKAQQSQAAPRTLKVKLKYSGAGTVDEKRQIFLFLFDSTDFMQNSSNATPIDRQTASAKEVTVSFSGIATSPVYLVALYDPTGSYQGMSAPPSGVSVGLYSNATGQPEPIRVDAGKTAEIALAIDDDAKTP